AGAANHHCTHAAGGTRRCGNCLHKQCAHTFQAGADSSQNRTLSRRVAPLRPADALDAQHSDVSDRGEGSCIREQLPSGRCYQQLPRRRWSLAHS
ncbi:unnamed protein product, partial [Symbiodinium pilosum]